MGLVDLRTDLKSLRFGKDRVGGGSSNQPYKTRPIPDSLSDTDITGGPDFLLRGGTLALRNSVRDISRLTQMFFDFKNPSGPLFSVKQNILSRTSVNTQSSPTVFNDGLYLPTSTIAQAGVNALGIHLNKQGIDPTGLFETSNLFSQPSYSSDLQKITELETNRLIQLKQNKIDGFTTVGEENNIPNADTQILQYDGGPGAKLGIGKTVIRRWEDTRDRNKLFSAFKDENFTYLDPGLLSSYDSYQQLGYLSTIRPDFRTLKEQSDPNFTNIPKTLDYTTENIEQRVNLGNPGKKGNKSSYVRGKNGTNTPLDKINALPLYQSSDGVIQNSIKNDLVKFRIGVIDNDNPKNKTYIHFRAFIDSMSDSYSSTWNSMDFVGRGETLYRYGGGFNRSVNLSWTVAAQSKDELIPMYQKLNYLASVAAPDYSSDGYMRGNLISLTLGGWFFEQVGFIEGITYDVPQESPWEIAIPDSGVSTTSSILTDDSVKEMPHIIKVTGFKFTPIQGFLPKIQKNNYAAQSFQKAEADFVSSYGNERYIMLSDGGEHVYRNESGERIGQILADNYGEPNNGEITDGNFNYIPNNVSKR